MAADKPDRTPPRDDFVREMLGDRDYGGGDVVAIAALVGDSPPEELTSVTAAAAAVVAERTRPGPD